MMDKMKDMKTKKRTLKKEEKKESEMEYVIRAENVDYTYEGSKIKALDHLSLNIRKGKKVAVMGGNGCGKSTFFLCLNGIRSCLLYTSTEAESELSNLQTQFDTLIQKANELELKLIKTGEAIIQAQADLEAAEEKKEEQYEACLLYTSRCV